MRGASTRMAARVAGGGGWLLDRGAAARGGLMSRVGASAAAAPARSLSTAGSSGDRRRGGSGGRRGGFWSKWNAATQQEFEQQVSLDGDKRSERRRSPLRQIGREASSLDPRDDYDDLEFALEDALENVQPSPAGAKDAEARSRGTAEAEAMRDALLNDDAVSSRRRSELLSLLDELSPAALLPLPPYPRPDATGAEPGGAADFFGGEDDAAAASLSMVGSFIDSARLRESGALPDGGYFAHVLHTRRVSKVECPCLVARGFDGAGRTQNCHTRGAKAKRGRGMRANTPPGPHLPPHPSRARVPVALPPTRLFPLPPPPCFGQVTGAGKKGSISVLAVVGNGNGTAGFGLGKDGEATTALVKACRAAKKRLLHVERFDDRTIFHDIEDKWAKTKVGAAEGGGAPPAHPPRQRAPLPTPAARAHPPLARNAAAHRARSLSL